MNVYFDNSATTRVSEDVIEIMNKVMREDYGNPSSKHVMGVDAEKYVKEAKNSIGKILKADSSEIYFTSGGTEGNNLALFGASYANKRSGNKILVSSIEHESVLEPAKELRKAGFDVEFLKVDSNGYIDLDYLKEVMSADTIMVSVMHVNNEVGVIEPIKEIGDIVKAVNPGTVFHVDGVQSFGKIKVDLKNLPVDMFTASGHKIHGPKGSGFVYIRKGTKFNPCMLGGGQQRGVRSGTENVPGIAGLTQASIDAYEYLTNSDNVMSYIRDFMTKKLSEMEDVRILSGTGKSNAPHIVSASFKNIRSEVLLHALEEKGIYISSGSACSSNRKQKSATLTAMGIDEKQQDETVRFSFSRYNTIEEADYCIGVLCEIVPVLKRYVRR